MLITSNQKTKIMETKIKKTKKLRKIYGHPDYLINKDGDIINRITGQQLKNYTKDNVKYVKLNNKFFILQMLINIHFTPKSKHQELTIEEMRFIEKYRRIDIHQQNLSNAKMNSITRKDSIKCKVKIYNLLRNKVDYEQIKLQITIMVKQTSLNNNEKKYLLDKLTKYLDKRITTIKN